MPGGLLALVWAFRSGQAVAWAVAALLAAAGAFALYEAARGWCAARALGFKTPF